MKRLYISSMILMLVGCASFNECNKIENPKSRDYPCGTRAHPCSLNPLTCCWNDEVCGGPIGSGCPENMCCFVGSGYSAQSPAYKSETSVEVKPQWSVFK